MMALCCWGGVASFELRGEVRAACMVNRWMVPGCVRWPVFERGDNADFLRGFRGLHVIV